MTHLERSSTTLNTLLPALCDYLLTKLSVYQSAFSFLELNADVLVKSTSHAVLPTAGSDDLKKVAAAVRPYPHLHIITAFAFQISKPRRFRS